MKFFFLPRELRNHLGCFLAFFSARFGIVLCEPKKPLRKPLKILSQFSLSFLFLLSPLFGEDPWGKGCALVNPSYQRPEKHQTFLGEDLIWFHKKVVSPADGPRSHHKPNSSQYTMDAMRKYGFFHGYFMGCDRLMRENEDPWIYQTVKDEKGERFKWDPVK